MKESGLVWLKQGGREEDVWDSSLCNWQKVTDNRHCKDVNMAMLWAVHDGPTMWVSHLDLARLGLDNAQLQYCNYTQTYYHICFTIPKPATRRANLYFDIDTSALGFNVFQGKQESMCVRKLFCVGQEMFNLLGYVLVVDPWNNHT